MAKRSVDMHSRKIPLTIAAVGGVMLVAGLTMSLVSSKKSSTAPPAKTAHVGPSAGAKAAQKALIGAANRHKVDPRLLLAISWFESIRTFSVKIRPRRKNGTTIGSAIGLCQFISKTRVRYGLPESNAHMLKTSAVQQADACARLMADNIKVLKASVGKYHRGDVYLAHFLGVTKAIRFAKAKPRTLTKKMTTVRERKSNPLLVRQKTAGALRRWADHKMATGIKRVAIFVKRAPDVAGWRAVKTDDEFFSKTGNPELWVNKQ